MGQTGRAFLVVDDDHLAAAAVSRLVRHAARRPTDMATSFAAARTLLDDPKREYCGLVLDVVLSTAPGAPDGFAVLSVARTRWPAVPAVMLSGHLEAPLINRAAKLRAGYVAKPAGVDELKQFIATALAQDLVEDPRLARVVDGVIARAGLETTRGGQLLRLVVAGVPAAEIERVMHIHSDAYAAHVGKILKKTGTRTMAELRIAILTEALGRRPDR